MILKVNLLLLFILSVSSFSFAQSKRIDAIKEESSITYQLTHPMHEIEATSKEAICSLDLDPAKKEITHVFVQIDVTSFNSGNSNRDSHAMEVIDALTYPDVQFSSTGIVQKGDSVIATGRLTFHGVTNEVSIAGASKWSEKRLIVTGEFEISLTAFNVERPSLLLIPVKDNLRFSFTQVFNF